MKKLTAFLFILTLTLPGFAQANVKNEFEWHLVDGAPKRTLHVCFHRSLNEQWKTWGQTAVDTWNKETKETGWKFDVVPFTKDRCQIFIIMRDIKENETGGAEITPLDTLEGSKEKKDGRVNAAIITIDANLESTKKWITEDEDVDDGNHDGWSTSDLDGTRDPIDTVIHELGHALRLDHHDDYDRKNPDQDLTDPKQPGEHYHRLSKADIQEAKDSSTAEWKRVSSTVNANGAKNLQLGDISLDIPEYSFGFFYKEHEIGMINATDMLPVPLNVPSGFSHVFYGFELFSDGQLQQNIKAQIPYTNEMLQPSQAPLKTTERFYTPGLNEDTINVVKFKKSPWDLTPLEIGPNPSQWTIVEGAELDTENNVITFDIDEFGFYGLIAQADPQQPPVITDFQRVLNGNVAGVEDLERALFIKNIRESIISQIPAFASGMGIGGFLIYFFVCKKRKLKSTPNEKRDSDSISDV